ncbi:kinase-like domain-containing protein [Chlamydoabsidia padenii]|nr:kinase-like domain-containing protein [Chlamydoabsidia padenii]
MATGTNQSTSPSSPSLTPLPTNVLQHSTRKKQLDQQDTLASSLPSTLAPQEEPNKIHRHSPSSRRSNSLHRKASNISKANGHTNYSQTGDNNHRPQIQRRSSESRKQQVKIQNYVIYRKTIGQGSMGKVKLAECLTDRDQQKYAVKIMPKVDLASIPVTTEKPKDPKDTPQEREQRTVRELAIMYLLRHPNICKLVDWISEGDYYYMFLEYVDGGQLLDYIIRHGKLREKQARKFARQIASALDYCHRNSIVHRDLKIENILITRDENIKIIDFGLSNIYSPSKLLSTFCGSLYFAAPELLKARQYTGPEVDVWSFGVVLYVLVCGRVPFDDTSLPALHAKIKSGIVDEYPEHLSKDCVDLLSKILVVDPRKRLTLTAVINHPWMKKGYEEAIHSNIPQRQVLEKVDMDIVKGMHGFGLGDEKLIKSKLDRLIKTPEYKQAVSKIEQNQQLEWQRQHQIPIPRWRRSITPTNKKAIQTDDDPLSLPAMYDPLLSIYYLVKERKEYNTRRQLDMVESKPLYHSAGGLSRSTSTVAPRSKTVVPPVKSNSSSTTLIRRKTDVARQSEANNEPVHLDSDIAPRHQRKLSISSRLGRSSSVRQITKSVVERTNSIREKSKGAVKILGSMLPNRPLMFTDLKLTNKRTSTIITTTSDLDSNQPSPTSSSSHKKQQWLQSDPHSAPIDDSKVSSSFSSSSSSTTATAGSKPYQHNRRPLSLIRQEDNHAPSCMDQSTLTDHGEPTRLSESNKDRQFGHHPTTKFHFGRGTLFRDDSAQQMMIDLRHVLDGMNVKVNAEMVPFKYNCQCDYPDWTKFIKRRQQADETGPLVFSVMVYQARWAHGRFGIKMEKSQATSRFSSRVFKTVQHCLELELDSYIRIRKTTTT